MFVSRFNPPTTLILEIHDMILRPQNNERPLRSRLFLALTLFAALGLLASTPLLAQAGPGHGRGHGPGHGDAGHAWADAEHGEHSGIHRGHLQRLIRHLDLTADQKESAREIFGAAQDDVEPIRDAQKERHEALRSLLDAGSADAAEVGALMIAMHDSRDQVKTVHEAAMAEFKELLTGEQLAKLESLHDRRGERRRDRRGGGSDEG